MNQRLRQHINSYFFDYLKKEFPELKYKKNQKQHYCPVCKHKERCANIFPLTNPKINCLNPGCNFNGDIFDFIKHTKDNFKNSSIKSIADYLSFKMKIEPMEDIDELLDFYESRGFAMIPLASGVKVPPKGFKWRAKVYKDKRIWKDWVDRGWGLAIVLGEDSGVDAVDIDSDEAKKKMESLLDWDTLTQTTYRGLHLIVKHNPEIYKTLNSVLRNDGYEMEYRTTGAYVVVAPTSADGEKREWNYKDIKELPDKAKEFFKKYLDKRKGGEEELEDDIQQCIDNEKIDVVDLSGKRNDTFVKLGGILRKKLNTDQTKYVMSIVSNNLIDTPLPKHELNAMLEQINKYNTYDKEELSNLILDRLDKIKSAGAYQLANTLKYDQKDVEDVLKYLEDEGKIIHEGYNRYAKTNEVEWTSDFSDTSCPVDFIVPYFNDYAYFDWGNIVIIGATSGRGKTHITGNIIKKLVDQNIQPDLISTEAGSKIGKVCSTLGIKNGSFFMPKKPVAHPNQIELRDNRVTLIDWLRPKDGNYAEMENTYAHLHGQMKKHNGFLFIFTQLRPSNGEFYAKDQIDQFGAFVCKYMFGDDGNDPINTYFKTQKIRDPKVTGPYHEIPMHFDIDTKILDRRQ